MVVALVASFQQAFGNAQDLGKLFYLRVQVAHFLRHYKNAKGKRVVDQDLAAPVVYDAPRRLYAQKTDAVFITEVFILGTFYDLKIKKRDAQTNKKD